MTISTLQSEWRGEQKLYDVPPLDSCSKNKKFKRRLQHVCFLQWGNLEVVCKWQNPFTLKWGIYSSPTGPRLMDLKEKIQFPLAHWSTESFTCQGMRNPSYSFIGICTVMGFWYETGCKYASLPDFTTEILLISLNGSYFPKREPYNHYSMSRKNQILPVIQHNDIVVVKKKTTNNKHSVSNY